MLRKTILIMGVMIGLLTVSSCDKDDDDDDNDNIVLFAGAMNGANESPASPSTATGNVTGSFDRSTKILTLTITYTGLSSAITAWHVHKGAVGVSGSPLTGFDWGTMGASPWTWSSSPLDATNEADLMNNLLYVNIHTVDHGGGEIRGQLTKQ
ncbi:MAG TPA: CHRD domain-containing protein [Chitinophagaceae bacterium]|nr:CHRD domain-containing protein [Chitinophagaceae bacterium]